MENKPTWKSNIEEILRKAVNYWAMTLNIQILFSLLYFSIIFLLGFYFFKYYGLLPEFMRLMKLSETDIPAAQKGILEWAKVPDFASFVIAMVVIKAVMFPLNIGLFQIYRNIDEKLPYSISDLYAGYRGFNFFKFLGFGIFWGFINLYAHVSVGLVFIWILITVFSAPLMYFMNISIFESIRLTVKAYKIDFFTIFSCCVLAFIFSYFGLIFFLLGIFFTFPFWNAVIYAMYQKYFNEIKKEVLV
ncbi:hypothetical protein [Halpernia frigidisoli]|uniref:Uncharacterized protein n=1 Tax=Halpernia frigidisoli TaxID=1125876 RepID=A0A1I3GI99_9FLAO|nr:hypothetical protein [Halpernia frigidisoli]SFI23164.1 hypothetical protein SAMN05443292_1855 [Halpernia frigidisoli]